MIEFRAERPVWSDSLDLYAKRTIEGKVYALTCEGIKVTEAKSGEIWPRFLNLDLLDNAGQSLFDALWSVGFRPNSGESSVAHVEAMRNHLADLRRLVFSETPQDNAKAE